jgi:hypothetical protein
MYMSAIYGLLDGETLELRYIGQTAKPLAVRFLQHCGCHSANVHLNNWLKSCRPNIITLEREPEDLDAAEIKWIADMRAQGARLLNLTDGGCGGGNRGRRFSPAHRSKISAALKGKSFTAEHCAKMSAALKGKPSPPRKPRTAEHCAALSAAHKGKHHSAEARAKMRIAHKGKRLTAEHRAKISAALKGRGK